jgi:hypothetical protein
VPVIAAKYYTPMWWRQGLFSYLLRLPRMQMLSSL